MKNNEFGSAVDAYLDYTATSWQTFLVEDHFDSYSHELDVLELHRDSEIQVIYERIKAKIDARINALG